jgi:hypothetical protein
LGIQIIDAESGQAFKQFINFPWSIYRDDPYWVPPLKSDVRELLSLKHPFYDHAERNLFLATKGGVPVGRIVAIINHRHNEFHSEKTGFFGFFECVDDQETADALFDAAEKWIRDKGMDRVLGPANPSTNEECGLLVHNFLSPPFVMMTYNPPYYMDLVEKAGYGKAKDLYAYWYHIGRELPDRLRRIVKKVQAKETGLVVRPLDMSRFNSELDTVRTIYNEAWEKNWGFIPMTDAEIDHMAKKLKPLVAPSIVNLAFVDDKPAGFAMALPDFNQVLKVLNGTIANPVRTIKALRVGKRLRSARCLTIGVREEFRKRGIESLLFAMTWQGGIDLNYRYGELSWVLEDNQPMIDGITRIFSGEHYKTYRIYEKQLASEHGVR